LSVSANPFRLSAAVAFVLSIFKSTSKHHTICWHTIDNWHAATTGKDTGITVVCGTDSTYQHGLILPIGK
jgi:hypothetical protein